MPSLTIAGYALVGITAVMAVVLVVLLLSLLRMSRLSRAARDERAESSLMSTALQEALTRLRAQERAMAARAEASERLSGQIIAGVAAGLIVVDRHAAVQIVNPAARRILGLGAGGEGGSIATLIAHVGPLARAISETLHTGVPVARRQLRLEGKPSHLGVSVSPLIGADGQLQAAVCLFSDLTEVVELEEQLRLKEALAGVGELTAGLAHEFRNGLATIHGYARLLDPSRLPDPSRAYVVGIRQETDTLGEVVTNFLNFARPEPLTLAPLELRAIIERAVADLSLDQGRVTIAGEFGRVLADEVLLRQAISNLIRNSAEACAGAAVIPTIHVDGVTEGASIRVTVEDNGPGIPADALAHIFKPFVTTKAHGTGLGLAIVQKVIVSHNGRILAETVPTAAPASGFSSLWRRPRGNCRASGLPGTRSLRGSQSMPRRRRSTSPDSSSRGVATARRGGCSNGGMRIMQEERGTTLLEAIVAGGLLVTIATSTATLIGLARRLGNGAEQLMAATTLATARLQALRAVAWEYGLDGSAEEVDVLAIVGGNTLQRNTPGLFEVVDETGRVVAPGTGPPAYTLRWAIGPTAGASSDTRSLEVCAFAWPAPDGSPPLACVASARVRQS